MSVTLGIIAAVIFTLFFALLFAKLLADRKLAGKMIAPSATDSGDFRDAAIRISITGIIVLAVITFSFKTYAVNGDDKAARKVVSEKMPEYPGGQQALTKYLSQIEYPVLAKTNDIQGTVKIKFTIKEDGQVAKVNVLEGVNRHLNKAAINHVKHMPNWSPGINKLGDSVSVELILPVSFVLE